MSDEELIRGYFNRNLSKNQIITFDEKYKTDSAFRASADQIELEILAFRDIERDSIKSKFDAWEKEEPDSTLFNWKVWIGVAAALVIGLSLLLIENGKMSDEEIFAQYYKTYENYELTSLRNENDSSERAIAYKEYDGGNYESAARKLQILSSTNQADKFFLALCEIELNNFKSSEKLLREIIQSDSSSYQNESQWYLSLILIKQGQTSEAINVLEKLHKSTEAHRNTDEILETLKSR